MNQIFKSILRPTNNRHYTNSKTSLLMYFAQIIPGLMLCVVGALLVSSIFWLVLGVLIIVLLMKYLLLDAFTDKLSWKLLWRRFYEDETKPNPIPSKSNQTSKTPHK